MITDWVGGVQKGQNLDYVIFEWPLSSTERMLKTSILPIVVNGNTKLHTLTQTYFITRLIEAVKTIPPLEFIPTSAFTDFDNVLEEAGSEKHEQLLPGL